MGKVRILLAALLLPLVILTAVSTIVLWPDHRKHDASSAIAGIATSPVNGTITRVDSAPCPGDPSGNVCDTISFKLTSGPDKGQTASAPSQQGPGVPKFAVGDDIVLGRSADSSGAPATYYISDYQRKPALGWLGLAFAVIVVLIGRWRGVGALLGLGFTWLVVTNFLLPSILEGRSPVFLAITAAALVCFVVLYVAHGFSTRTTTALIGTLLGLVLTGVLASVAVTFAHITGLSSDDITSVQNYAGQVNIKGLLLAGMVIGALGVLNDVTVTQSSAVWEVQRANPSMSRFELYRSGMRVGRDHVASTVYTLVLAYVGAALPLLVLFSICGQEWSQIVGTDVVGEEIVRTVAGSIGLMLAVPLTTALAAYVAGRATTEETVVITEPHTVADAPVEDTEAKVPASVGAVSAEVAEPVTGEHFSDGLIHTDNESIASEPEENGQINPEAYPPAPLKRGIFRRRNASFNRKMSRRERKFWNED